MTKPFTPDDIYLHQEISEMHCSPQGDLVACSVVSPDREKGSNTSHIWICPLDGTEPWQMTHAGAKDTTPRWSPDGKQLAFISDRVGNNQVFLISADGGEARQLGQFNGSVLSCEWSPDGQRLALTCSLQVDSGLRGQRPDPDASLPAPDAPVVVWKLPYKADGMGFILNLETHLFIMDVSTGNATQLTDGPFNVRSANWSPDCQSIVYVRTREDDESHRTDVWTMGADGSNARQMTTDYAQVTYPAWSPDGRWIVFSGTYTVGDAQTRLGLIDVESGNVQSLGEDSIEISTEGQSVQFLRGDSSRVLAIVANRGVQEAVEITVPDGQFKTLAGGERHLSKLVHSKKFLVYVAYSAVSAMEVYCCRHDGSGEKVLTRFNAWWKDRIMASMERRKFEVPDGDGGTETIDGWLLRPPDVQGATPLLVDAHGGPASYVLFEYDATTYWSLLWSQGYSILALNPVGSASYGRAFADRLRGRWGELDFPQFLAAIQQLQAEGLCDDRVAIAGKSYGGYMGAWAIGHSTQFRAAVVLAPVANIETHFGTSDSGYYSDPYTIDGEDQGIDLEALRRLSPTLHAHKARTPTLILQGEDDQRCPRAQAEELFMILRRKAKIPCEMVIYPGESHKFTSDGSLANRLDVMQRIVDWVTRWAPEPLPEEGPGT